MDERRQPMMRKRREVELRVKVNLNQEFSKKRERERGDETWRVGRENIE